MSTTSKWQGVSLYLVLNNVVNLKLTEHGRIQNMFHAGVMENILEEYISNVSF